MHGVKRFLSSRPTSEFLDYQKFGAKVPFIAEGGA